MLQITPTFSYIIRAAVCSPRFLLNKSYLFGSCPCLPSLPARQVRQLQESAAQLRTVYAGEKAEAIACREHEVMQCWKELLTHCEECRVQITTETDKLKFFGMVRDQIMWMDSVICQIGTGEKPRYLQPRGWWK